MFREASADIRAWANIIAQAVAALEQQGFSRDEAIEFAKVMISGGS